MTVIINIIIILLWHLVANLLVSNMGAKFLNYKAVPFKMRKYENYGAYYEENFYIDRWCKLLPVKLNTENVTADDIEQADVIRLKQYMTTTCRSEFCGIINSLCAVLVLFINAPHIGFIIAVLVVLGNLPFIFANRYIRLGILKKYNEKLKQREIRDYIELNNPDKYDLDTF